MQTSHALLIQGGIVVTSEDTFKADVLTEGETVRAIGRNLSAPEGTEVIAAEGLLVLPGVIDAHAHIQLDTGIFKTPDDWFVESRAAAYGGVTTVIDFATQFPGQTLRDAVAARLRESAPSVIDYAYHVMVTDLPPGQEDKLELLPELGTTSLKLYTTYRPNYYADDATILRLLKAASRYGLMTLIHCENDALVTAQTEALIAAGRTGWRYHGESRPALAEQEAAGRVLFLAQAAGAPVVIAHNSSAVTSRLVSAARRRGQPVFCETAPQYLLLDNERYAGDEPWRYILQPPLRAPAEKEALWELVNAGEIDMLITDHCAYQREQKLAQDDFTQTPGGLPGMETLLPLAATYGVDAGRITWNDLVRLLAVNPAQIYNLWPRKGALLPGSDADLVLYDPQGTTTLTAAALHSSAGYSPYEGLAVKGHVVSTIRRGEVVVRDSEFVGTSGSGEFIRREPQYWR
ncbi:MAG: dihydropyrimidinase [Chloroflexota bacterium]|nr:dihydropyrimidinase [Chloroflexota bacterium]